MLGEHSIDAHGLVTALVNQINRISSLTNNNNDFLFPGINKSDPSKRVQIILEQIVKRADEFRNQIEDETNKLGNSDVELRYKVRRMNWHNSTRKHLKELHSAKYDFYKELKKYITH